MIERHYTCEMFLSEMFLIVFFGFVCLKEKLIMTTVINED